MTIDRSRLIPIFMKQWILFLYTSIFKYAKCKISIGSWMVIMLKIKGHCTFRIMM